MKAPWRKVLSIRRSNPMSLTRFYHEVLECGHLNQRRLSTDGWPRHRPVAKKRRCQKCLEEGRTT